MSSPQRPLGYGSLDGSTNSPILNVGSGFESEALLAFDNDVSHSEGRRGRPSWLRAGIMVTIAASALAVAVAASRLTSYAIVRGGEHAIDTERSGSLSALSERQQQRPPQVASAVGVLIGNTKNNSPTIIDESTGDTVLLSKSEAESYPLADEGPRVSGAQTPSMGELTFIAQNEYTMRGDIVGTGYPWLRGEILVEPYRDTFLEVVSRRNGMTYTWTIFETGSKQAVLGEYEGEEVMVKFGQSPLYTVVLTEASSIDGKVVREEEVDVFCKYVRREVRSLFMEERKEVFDAMKVLWDVRTEEGVALYGEKYIDLWTIDQFHQVGASDIVCDHLHDGIGFGITHSMVTMMFENSLQLVNPKLSLPYWDFTIDSYLVDTFHDGDYEKLMDVSDLWTEEWFGSVDPDDWQVKDGRWGFMEVPIVSMEDRELISADVFGRMRSPWNVNDRPHLTRGLGDTCGISSTEHYPWPTCEEHYTLQEMFTSYYGYTWQSQYEPHGPVHIWIGGNFDCKETMDTYIDIVGEEYRESVTGKAFLLRKDLYRAGDFSCDGFAGKGITAADVMSSGQCGCPDFDLNNDKDVTYLYHKLSMQNSFPEVTTGDQHKMVKAFCQGTIAIGESSQSSSPLDPSFWLLHPTMERLLGFKLLSGFDDVSWPDEAGLWTGMDGIVYDVVISLESDDCYGHRGSDIFPYGILKDRIMPEFTFYGETGPNTRTNRDMIKYFSPYENALSFIYDNFEWAHCAAQGYDFNDLYDLEKGSPGRTHTSSPKDPSQRVHGFGLFDPEYPGMVPRFPKKKQ